MDIGTRTMRACVAALLALALVMCAPVAPEHLGDAMIDMGSAMRDAASDDASAQDVGRYASGNALTHSSYEGTELAAGPFLLEHAEVSMAGEESSRAVRLYASADCTNSLAAQSHVTTLWTSVRSGYVAGFSGRHFVPAGSRLCAELVFSGSIGAAASVGWSGQQL